MPYFLAPVLCRFLCQNAGFQSKNATAGQRSPGRSSPERAEDRPAKMRKSAVWRRFGSWRSRSPLAAESDGGSSPSSESAAPSRPQEWQLPPIRECCSPGPTALQRSAGLSLSSESAVSPSSPIGRDKKAFHKNARAPKARGRNKNGQKKTVRRNGLYKNGGDGGTRTHDLSDVNRTLSPAELRLHIFV